MGKINLKYSSRALNQYHMRADQVKKYKKLLLKIESDITNDNIYFRECELNQLTKQEVLNLRKKQRQHINKQNMMRFYKKKIIINSN